MSDVHLKTWKKVLAFRSLPPALFTLQVSLCEAEASVAAPLTSRPQTIACMAAVVAEGRCSLQTSYLIFQFIIVYAFVQVTSCSLAYSYGSSMGNWQYLIQVREEERLRSATGQVTCHVPDTYQPCMHLAL